MNFFGVYVKQRNVNPKKYIRAAYVLKVVRFQNAFIWDFNGFVCEYRLCFIFLILNLKAINLKNQELLIYHGTELKKLKHYVNIYLLITNKLQRSVYFKNY